MTERNIWQADFAKAKNRLSVFCVLMTCAGSGTGFFYFIGNAPYKVKNATRGGTLTRKKNVADASAKYDCVVKKERQGNNMKKWIAMILMAVMMLGLLTACGNTNGAEENPVVTQAPKADISVAVMKGPTAIGMVKLMEENEAGNAANNYSFTVAGTADEIAPKLIKGELQMAAVPCNLASVLYNKTEGQISMLAINTLGVLYIVETGDSIQSVADLKGKTIFSTGKGTTPEYTLRYLLSAAGIDPDKDVTIEFKSEATEIAALLTDADNAVAMLPQPYVTTVMMNNDKVRIALDVTKEWESLTNGASSVVTGVIVAQKSFIEENKAAVDAFLAEYAESTLYANEQTEAAAELVEKYGIFKAAVAKKAIPYCNIVCVQGSEMETKAGAYLNTLFEQAPNAVGGKLPETDFYYKK